MCAKRSLFKFFSFFCSASSEWVEVLKAFRDAGDLNGNGVEDEYPLAVQFGAHDTFGSNDLFYRFTACFGQADSYCGGNNYADHLYIDENGKVVIDLLKKLVQDENYCVIVVTHDPGIAAQADVVYKMQDGRLAVEC